MSEAANTDLTAIMDSARLPALPKTGDTIPEGQEAAEEAGKRDKLKAQIKGLEMIIAFAEEADRQVTEARTADANAKVAIRSLIQSRVDAIDAIITLQLNSVLHDKHFKTLEATWRGLHYLVDKTETGTRLKLRVLDITKDELRKDLEDAVEFDQSKLFKKVYEEEYGTLGGKPYGCLIGDYAFNRKTPDIKMLERLAQVAAAAHAPFIAAADPDLFDMDDFGELPRPRDLAKIFETSTMAQWQSLRDSEDSRYLALLLPHVLMRAPYHPEENPVDGMSFTEIVGKRFDAKGELTKPPKEADSRDDEKDLKIAPESDNYVWGNPAWVLAERITKAFALHGWTAAIRGVEGGGKVEGLPLHKYRTLRGDNTVYVPTEVTITDRREKELSDQGFISLVYCKDTDYAAFFGGQTVNKPKKYNKPAANSNAELSARLPYILNTSRFAHYIKVMMRDKIGRFMTKENVQAYLTTWISDYVLAKDDSGQDIKARYPLREARIDVSDIPGRPGEYNATIFLRPHFQLEGLTASLRLVAELPAPVA